MSDVQSIDRKHRNGSSGNVSVPMYMGNYESGIYAEQHEKWIW